MKRLTKTEIEQIRDRMLYDAEMEFDALMYDIDIDRMRRIEDARRLLLNKCASAYDWALKQLSPGPIIIKTKWGVLFG